ERIVDVAAVYFVSTEQPGILQSTHILAQVMRQRTLEHVIAGRVDDEDAPLLVLALGIRDPCGKRLRTVGSKECRGLVRELLDIDVDALDLVESIVCDAGGRPEHNEHRRPERKEDA